MFSTLLESKRKKDANLGGSVVSMILHGLFIAGAVAGTAHGAKQAVEELKKEEVTYTKIEEEKPVEERPPEDQPPPPPDAPATPPPPKGFQTLQAPIEIPTVIPEIDLTRRVTNELDFSGQGVRGGIASGVVGGTGPVDVEKPYYLFEVEKMAEFQSGPKPNYPSMLRSMKKTGQVLVSFVVDTTGKADMATFKVVESDHQLFTEEVKRVLPRYKFTPAEIGNRKVPVYVSLPFEFTLDGGF